MTWVVILAVGAGSFVFRLGPLLMLQRVPLTERGDRIIRHAGTAAIAALIAVSARQSASGSATIPTVLAMATALGLAARGASMLRLLLCGGGIYAGSVVVMGLLAR
jgi:branched-subunit amino acid transport protein